jgi:integrase
VAEIRAIVARLDRTTPLGARDAALILLGFASALRRSELAALTLADFQAKPGGLLITSGVPRPIPTAAARSSAALTAGTPSTTPSHP